MKSETIDTVVNQMIKELENENWAKSDRLQDVLEQLVVIEVAKIESSRKPTKG